MNDNPHANSFEALAEKAAAQLHAAHVIAQRAAHDDELHHALAAFDVSDLDGVLDMPGLGVATAEAKADVRNYTALAERNRRAFAAGVTDTRGATCARAGCGHPAGRHGRLTDDGRLPCNAAYRPGVYADSRPCTCDDLTITGESLHEPPA